MTEHTTEAPATAEPSSEPAEAPAKDHKAITVYDTQASDVMDPNIYLQIKQISNDMVQSKALPAAFTNVYQVMMAVQTGREMGMTPMESIQSLYIVNGALSVWGKATVRRLTTHGWKISYKETPDYCEATITRNLADRENESYTERYTFEEAEKSGYTKSGGGSLKVGWREGINRRLKLRYGALSLIIKSYVPEVMGSAAGIVEVEQDFEPVDTSKQSDKTHISERLEAYKTKRGDVIDSEATAKPVTTLDVGSGIGQKAVEDEKA